MSGSRNRNGSFFRRRAWGSVRSKVRQKFAKGDFEVEKEWLRGRGSVEYNHYSFPPKYKWRWMLENQHGRWARSFDRTVMILGMMPGDTIDLERRYGIFFPRCRVCEDKMVYSGHLDTRDPETYGLCSDCASPIVKKRRDRFVEERERRSLGLAESLLPPSVIKDIQEKGWTDIRSRIGMVYRLDQYGTVYNVTTKQRYGVWVASSGYIGGTRLGTIVGQEVSYWDKVIVMWYVLTTRPLRVESQACKSVLTDDGWKKKFEVGEDDEEKA